MRIFKKKEDSKIEKFSKEAKKYLKAKKLQNDYKKSKGIKKVFKWIEMKVKGA